uniref:Pilus assembly protein HicB n=1 Tax=Candidatus Kentrum sp. DK TaxID=2126562 RepID=A0A450T5W4_9GAMM|nr:MAG: hypothetical protein BECKDK2373B_GA0170837_11055 [Candidatus Kentron sp. DK]
MKESDKYHKWVEWNEEDQVYIAKCPDLITGIHGDDPVSLYGELCELLEEVIDYFHREGRPLPSGRVKPMLEIA